MNANSNKCFSFYLISDIFKIYFSKSVCDEFEKIKARALKRPETTEELNDMVKFIDTAKTTGTVVLGNTIKELKKSMAYLLDVHLFPQEDIDLNTRVLLWPHEIGPIFDRNEEVIITY